jgi:hypothetical protein
MLSRKTMFAAVVFASTVSFWALVAHVIDALGGQPPKYISLLSADLLCVLLSGLLLLEVMYDRSKAQ